MCVANFGNSKNYFIWCFHFQVELTRENTTASFGMTLSKEYGGSDIEKVVFVETIVSASPADVAGLHRGDVIVSVEGQRIDSLKQAAKLIKNKTK
jgi:C-terminal processing protease CtpA/Prc